MDSRGCVIGAAHVLALPNRVANAVANHSHRAGGTWGAALRSASTSRRLSRFKCIERLLFRPLLDPVHRTWSGGVSRPRYVTPCRDVRRNVSSRRGTVCSMANTGKVQTQKGRGWGSMHPCLQSPSTHCTLSSQRWRWVGRDSRLAVCKLERCMGAQKHPALQTQPQRRGLQAVQHRPFDLRQQQCHAALGQAAL
jgi:hypothetical protein